MSKANGNGPKLLIAPTEPKRLRDIGEVSLATEANGVDILWAAQEGLWGIQRKQVCVGLDTRILTSDLRWIAASGVTIGDELMGFDEVPSGKHKKRHWKKTRVVAAKKVKLPSYLLSLSDGTEIVCSGEHRWLTRRSNEYEWSTTDQIHPDAIGPRGGDRHRELVRLSQIWDNTKSTWDHGYLAGAYDGEGHLQQRPSRGNGNAMTLVFGQVDNAMLSQVQESLDRLGFRNTTVVRSRAKEGWQDISVVKVAPRQEVMRFLGEIRPQRIMDKFNPDMMGQAYPKPKYDPPTVISKEYLGECDLMAITTEEGTFVAEGLASHNSDLIASKSDGRLSKELAQMGNLVQAVLIVEGRMDWTTEGELVSEWASLSRRQFHGMLWSIRSRGVWVEYTSSLDHTIEAVRWLADWSRKERHSGLRGRPGPVTQANWGSITDREWGIHLLCGLDGIGEGMAGRIYDHFQGVPMAWTVGEDELMEVRGIGKVKARKMVKALEAVKEGKR